MIHVIHRELGSLTVAVFSKQKHIVHFPVRDENVSSLFWKATPVLGTSFMHVKSILQKGHIYLFISVYRNIIC